jgi:hypothetical protein
MIFKFNILLETKIKQNSLLKGFINHYNYKVNWITNVSGKIKDQINKRIGKNFKLHITVHVDTATA